MQDQDRERNPLEDGTVTRLLEHVTRGSRGAAEELMATVYQELRSLAAAKLAREKPGQTIQATALVHEVYLRLFGNEQRDWRGRRYFFAACGEAMRRILVERARERQRQKRGGDRERVSLSDAAAAAIVLPTSIDLLALDEALDRLAAEDERKAELVKLRYFTGLTMEQAAQTLDISKPTAERDWAYARAWLYREVGKGD